MKKSQRACLVQSVATLLDQDRRLYLSFGPYWWFIKRLLIQYGKGDALHLTSRTDPRAAQWYKGMVESEIIAAALDVHRTCIANGHPYQREHLSPDDDQVEVHDSDME